MKTRILLTILCSVAGLAAPGFCLTTWDQLPEGDGEILTRVYDIATLNLPFRTEDTNVETLRLAPYSPGELELTALAKERYPRFNSDTIQYLLHSIVGEEQFEYEGISIGSLNNERLLVTGPESIHSRVSHVLAVVESFLNRKITIDVEIYTAESETALDKDDGPSIRQAAEQGALRLILKQQCCTVPGGYCEINTEKIRSIVLDFDPEIAQASIAYEPIVADIATGLSLSLRPFEISAEGTLLVGIHGLFSRLVDSSLERDLKFKGRLATNDKVEIIPVSNTVDSPAMEFASLATVVPLEPEKTAVLRSAFPHQSGSGSLVILLTARSCQTADRLDLGQGLYMSAIDFGFLSAESLLPSRFDKDGPFSEENFRGYHPKEDCTLTTLGRRGRMIHPRIGDVFELMLDECLPPDAEYYFEGDSFSFEESRGYLLGNLVVLCAKKEYIDKAIEFKRRMSATQSAPLHIAVLYVETKGPAVLTAAEQILREGRLVGALRVPMVPGGRAISLAGLEGLMIHHYDVDVANNSSCPDPRIRRYLDGAFVRLVHQPALSASSGAGVVQTEFYVNKLSGPMPTRNLGENGGMLGVIDQPEFDHTLFQTRVPIDRELHVVGTVMTETGGRTNTIYILAGGELD